VPRLTHTYALPLVSKPLFPGLITSVTLTDEATIEAFENLMEGNNGQPAFISTFLRKNMATGVTEGGVHLPKPELIHDANDIYHVGTFAQIQRIQRSSPSDDDSSSLSSKSSYNNLTSANTATLILFAHRRVDLVGVDDLGPPIDVQVKHWARSEYTGSDQTIRALSNEIISTIRELAQVNALFRESLQFFPMRVQGDNPFKLADFAASISASGSPEDLQAVLEEKNPEMRLTKALVLLNKEREVCKLQKEISEKVEEKLSEAQRKYFLTEMLKSIKKELGVERDDKEALIGKYRKTLLERPAVPKEAMDTIEEELQKFATLENISPECNVTRSYLDWLVGIPWGVVTDENFDITKARKIMDRDHYGLEDVKDTILQFIAIGKLMGSIQGKIICLAGPPGTGKTSIARSVAASLGRDFYRFSVGGLSDVTEIKGHRRTYIGAMPGKIIQCLKTTGSINPVILIDEIDKLGTGFRGDPASALLEVLDPSQNSTFRDHFLDIPVDISNVLFICTANDLDRIPGPLLDRLEVIRLSGYDLPEKVAIAEQYLVPKSMKESGLMVEKTKSVQQKENEGDDAESTEPSSSASSEDNAEPAAADEGTTPLYTLTHAKGIPESLNITNEAVKSLARWYAREAGVRNLAKYIDKITRKLALQVVAESESAELTKKNARKSDTWVVNEDNLVDYVGKPVFTSDRLYQESPLPHGIVMGLAYTSMGGSALYIETQGIKRGLDLEGKTRGGGTIKVTGQMGDVMKESTQIAYTVARAKLSELEPDNQFFDITDIHMHVPEGATPKDGPSAGITMVTSLLSLALKRPIKCDVAMTGEISLTGKVLAVGGIKEKIMGARRAGITTVVLPATCQHEFDEIPEYLKDGLEVHYADDYGKVFEVVFDIGDTAL
jgi:Lon-like ATP-dependent protease